MTLKIIPTALRNHYQTPATTKAYLLRLQGFDGTVVGLTGHDRNLAYDDGAGELSYKSTIGADVSALDSSSGLDVDNAEVSFLLQSDGLLSAISIDAGAVDWGEYKVYKVNWSDLTMGHELVDFGTIGIAKNVNNLSGVLELRSLQQMLKQTVGKLYSKTCRAKFGSGSGGTCVNSGDCGFDAMSLWQSHTVSSVGVEPDRIFTADSPPAVMGPNGALEFAPGLVHWTSGNNTGRQSEIESIDGAEITLRFGTPYAIEDADEFDTRPDCDKTWETCRDDYDNQLNFRGEPKIPTADEGAQATPNFSGTWSISDSVLPDIEEP